MAWQTGAAWQTDSSGQWFVCSLGAFIEPGVRCGIGHGNDQRLSCASLHWPSGLVPQCLCAREHSVRVSDSSIEYVGTALPCDGTDSANVSLECVLL